MLFRSAKEGNQRVLTGLKFHTQSENELIFERTKEKATLSLRNNDRVILYSQQDGKLSQVLKCTVTAIEADLVYLQPKNAEIKKELFSLNNEWIIENDSSDANLYGLIGSLGELYLTDLKENIYYFLFFVCKTTNKWRCQFNWSILCYLSFHWRWCLTRRRKSYQRKCPKKRSRNFS